MRPTGLRTPVRVIARSALPSTLALLSAAGVLVSPVDGRVAAAAEARSLVGWAIDTHSEGRPSQPAEPATAIAAGAALLGVRRCVG